MAMGYSTGTIWKWEQKHTLNIQRRTAAKILLALKKVRDADEARHRDSIHHGAKARGKTEKVPKDKGDFYKLRSSDSEAVRSRRRRTRVTT